MPNTRRISPTLYLKIKKRNNDLSMVLCFLQNSPISVETIFKSFPISLLSADRRVTIGTPPGLNL